ncbi:MAG TPA: DUF2380 domain-containing protein [Gemmatimonadales bacterium]|nr:DUF2380 domain-containing protein [Gemmatimonadales bacterium]
MYSRVIGTLVLLASFPVIAKAQGAAAAGADGRVAMLNVALYTAGANLPELTDTSVAKLATLVLDGKLRELLGRTVLNSDSVQQVSESDSARLITGGSKACNVIVACARYVGRTLGADWVVMGKVSKTSNLIWLFTGQLINVRTGKFLMDDSTELKGDPQPMVRAGTRIFAERVVRTIRQEEALSNKQ